MTNKTFQREIVESVCGEHCWPSTNAPTDGFMVSALEAIGVSARGKGLARAALIRLCNDNGLPFVDSPAKAVAIDENKER